MRLFRLRTIKYFTYISLLMCIGIIGLNELFDDRHNKSSNNAVLAGPGAFGVAQSIEHIEHTFPLSNRSTEPMLNPELQSIRCDRLIRKDTREMKRATDFLQRHGYNFSRRPDEDYTLLTQDCTAFKTNRGYFTITPSVEERSFPIAYNILFYENVEQFERLLRTIYRPQNQYCVHIDKKTPKLVFDIVVKITKCFKNVFVVSKPVTIVAGSYTRLIADLNCMQDHMERGYRWKYLLNMAATDLPIMSNLQIVKILKAYNGANDIQERVPYAEDKKKYNTKHYTYIDARKKTGYMILSEKAKKPPPFDMVMTMGSGYNIFHRMFVKFVFKSPDVHDFLAWCADTLAPDEHFWATLNNLYDNGFLESPGGYYDPPQKKPFFARYLGHEVGREKSRCRAGHYVHNMCVFSIEDFPMLSTRPEVIASKFDIEYDPVVYKCMEEAILNKSFRRTGINFEKTYQKMKIY